MENKFKIWCGYEKKMLSDVELFNAITYSVKQGVVTVKALGDSRVLIRFADSKDKNGIEVYEGDVLLIPDSYVEPVTDWGEGPIIGFNHLAPVVFQEGAFGIDIRTNEYGSIFHKGFRPLRDVQEEVDWNKSVEIIGNIYANPELLEPEPEHAAKTAEGL